MTGPATAGSIEETLRGLVVDALGIPPQLIVRDAAFDGELAMDSLSLIALQVEVERVFGIDCPAEEMRPLRRFRELVTLVEGKVAEQR